VHSPDESCIRPDKVDCTVSETLAVSVYTFYLLLLLLIHQMSFRYSVLLRLTKQISCIQIAGSGGALEILNHILLHNLSI